MGTDRTFRRDGRVSPIARSLAGCAVLVGAVALGALPGQFGLRSLQARAAPQDAEVQVRERLAEIEAKVAEAKARALEEAARAEEAKKAEVKKAEAQKEGEAKEGSILEILQGRAEEVKKAEESKKAPSKAEDAVPPAPVAEVQVQVAAPGQVGEVVVETKTVDVATGSEAKEGDEAAEPSQEATKPAEPKKPFVPVVRLRDGTRLAGRPSVKTLHVSTAYGKLEIPSKEVLRLRFAAKKDTSLSESAAELVQDLGSEEFDLREQAEEKLREIGEPALESLRAALESEDAEVKTRAEKLVAEIESTIDENDDDDLEYLTPIRGEDDEVVTIKFTVMGRVEEDSLSLETPYGSLDLSRDDIVSVVFREKASFKRTFKVAGSNFAAANKWMVTDLNVTQGEALTIAASGTLNLQNFGQTTGPEGTTSVSGNQFKSFPTGSLVARIGEKGEPFQLGSSFEGEANATGPLHFAISFQNGNVTGEYDVEVEMEVEEEES